MEEFEKHKAEFWKRFNRSKRYEKKLISLTLSYAESQGIEISVIPTYRESLINQEDLHILFDGESYDFSQVIDYSRKLNHSLYRKYEGDSKRCNEIFDSISQTLP